MEWMRARELLWRIEQLALPTRVSSLLLALLLGALLGGGLQTLFRTSTHLPPELPRWRSEMPKLNGPPESTPKSSIRMKTDFAQLNGTTTMDRGGISHE